MAEVLELEPASAPPHPAHRRLRWASQALSILFMVCLAG